MFDIPVTLRCECVQHISGSYLPAFTQHKYIRIDENNLGAEGICGSNVSLNGLNVKGR